MPTRQVTIQGVMTWDEASSPPGIWGPTDPRPSNPIANVPGIGNPNPPGWGARPEHPIYYPPGIWGPTDPRPGYGLPGPPPGIWGPPGPWVGNPIAGIPGLPGYEPPRPGEPGPPGSVQPPAANVPIHGSMTFVPGYGYVFIPDAARPTPPPDPGDSESMA